MVSGLQVEQTLTLPYPESAVAVNPADGSIWSDSSNPAVLISFNPATGAPLALGASLLANAAPPQGIVAVPAVSKVYVFNSSLPVVEVSDASTLKLLSTISAAPNPFFSPSSYSPGAAAPDGSLVFLLANQQIQAINTSTGAVVGSIATDSGVGSIAVSPDSKTLFAAASVGSDDELVFSWDAGSLKSLAISPTFSQDFTSLMVSPDNKELYAVGPDSSGVNWLYVLDPITLSTKSFVQVAGSQAVLSKTGKTVYVLESPAPDTLAIQAVDTGSFATTRTYPITLTPTLGILPNLALSPDGAEIFVSAGSPFLSINLATGKQTNSEIGFSGQISF